MKDEINVLHENKTWSLVPHTNDMNIVDSKWVFKVKKNSYGSVDLYKARLLARGFTQMHGFDYDETFNPIVKPRII